MIYGQTLIDKAAKVCGSAYKLSKETGFSEANISRVRAGKRELPIEWVPVLAEIAGVNARDAVAEVLAEQMPEGSRARAILGGVRAVGVAAMLLFFVVLGLLQPLTTYAAEGSAASHPTHRGIWAMVKLLFFMARGQHPGRRKPSPCQSLWQANAPNRRHTL